MPKFFITSSVVLLTCLALARPAFADTRIGIQLVALSGTHFESKENVSGNGFGGFIHIDQRWPSLQIHIEGIPSVGTALVDTGTGPVRASVGLFDATARIRADRAGRIWLGVGTEILAQRTPQAGVSKIDASRLAGSRYEIVGELPTSGGRFVETQFAVMPHLAGMVYETKTAPLAARYSVSGAETATMTDLSAAYGIRRGRVDYLVGGRTINFAAKFVDGREADRNVGGGLFVEIRVRV
jgi:hypothetical protein